MPNIAVVLHGFVFCEFTGTQMISVCNASVFWGDMTLAYHMFAVKVQKQKFHSEINRDRRAGEQLHTGDRVSYLMQTGDGYWYDGTIMFKSKFISVEISSKK